MRSAGGWMMAFIDKLVARWKEDRQRMQEQVEWMESGKSQVGPWLPRTGYVDTTADHIDRYKVTIAKLDDLIARHPEAK
jgi:hypothetical protein